MKMELAPGTELSLEGGKVSISHDLNTSVVPKIDEMSAKIASKEVDLIPGTEWEVGPALAALAMLKAEILK